MFFLVLFIFIYPVLSNGLICAASIKYFIQTDEFDFNHFSIILSSFETVNNDNNEPCRLKLFLIEENHNMGIYFGKEFTPSVDLYNGATYLETIINFDSLKERKKRQKQIHSTKILEHSCSQQDDCDRLFILQVIQNFIKQNNNEQLHQLLMPLLIKKNSQKVLCLINDRKGNKCPYNLCVNVYWSDTKEVVFRCLMNIEDGIMYGVKIYIENYFIPISNDTNQKRIIEYDNIQMIKYICNYNQCNNSTIGNHILQIIEQHYNIFLSKSLFNIEKEQIIKQESSTIITFNTTFFTSTPSLNLFNSIINNTVLSTNLFISSSSLPIDFNDLSSNLITFSINEETSIINDSTVTYIMMMKNEVVNQVHLARIDLIVCLIISFYYIAN